MKRVKKSAIYTNLWAVCKMKKVMGLILTLLLAVFLSLMINLVPTITTADPATIWVPYDYPTIQEAIDASSPGDTIKVAAGTYLEHPTITKSITLEGENSSNTIIDGNLTGTVVYIKANNVQISGFTIRNSGSTWPDSGIHLDQSNGTTIANNNVTNNYLGLYLYHSNANTVNGTAVTKSFWRGIYLRNSHNNTLINNAISDNFYGIEKSRSSDNNLTENVVTNNWVGIHITRSDNNKLRNNTMENNHYNLGVSGVALSNYIQDMDASNTINGKPVHYLINQKDLIIDPTTFPSIGYLGLVNSTNITVKNLTLTANGQGLLLAYTTSSTITNVNASHNNEGIHLHNSSKNNLNQNTITENEVSLYLTYSSSNVISRNIITSLDIGLNLRYSSNNSITGNNITQNYYGTITYYSSNNTIYNNNFVNNTEQVESYNSINRWDFGYPHGGNYWSDYVGVDEFSGSNQDQPGSDGIGDTPYVIDADNQDNYPLMNPWTPLIDVAVTNLTTSKTRLTLGEALYIYVSVENQGNYAQTFDVNVSYTRILDPLIGTRTITLASGANATLTFEWTPDMTGRYEIRAEATTLPGEADNTDNTLTIIIYVEHAGSNPSNGSINGFHIAAFIFALSALIIIPKSKNKKSGQVDAPAPLFRQNIRLRYWIRRRHI